METVARTVKIDAKIDATALQMLDDFGMDLSTAVNVFLKQMVYDGALPFKVTRDKFDYYKPNDETLEAIREYEEFKAHPENFKTYDSFADLLKEVEAEDEDEDDA